MAQNSDSNIITKVEKSKLKRELTLLPLFGLIYFTVCGGSFGAEPMVGWSGPGLAILLFLLTPLFFSIPNMLMVREMQSMMPIEGGYYHWLKKAFGPFVGFMGGWMNWVVAWVDVSIYPVLAAYYLGYFIPALREGATIGGVFISSTWLSFLVAIVLIWSVSYLNVRGARLSGLTTDWLGIVMMIPLVLMSILGIISWIKSGVTIHLPFLPGGEPVNFSNLMGALSTGIFVAMWNFMGWELPTAAGDEIVNPKKTYPLAMVLVLIATIATYSIPTITGLYGGAGEDGKYQLWGIEEYESGEGIGPVLEEYGVKSCIDKASKYYQHIIFPIKDEKGVLYFDARYYGTNKSAPRWRCPDGAPRSKTFFNWPYGKKGLPYLCFVEGASDALKLISWGLKYTIPAKTFSSEQFGMVLKSGVERLFLAYDQDEAGRYKVNKEGENVSFEGKNRRLFGDSGREIKIVTFPRKVKDAGDVKNYNTFIGENVFLKCYMSGAV